jgi:hypothetical protein
MLDQHLYVREKLEEFDVATRDASLRLETPAAVAVREARRRSPLLIAVVRPAARGIRALGEALESWASPPAQEQDRAT